MWGCYIFIQECNCRLMSCRRRRCLLLRWVCIRLCLCLWLCLCLCLCLCPLLRWVLTGVRSSFGEPGQFFPDWSLSRWFMNWVEHVMFPVQPVFCKISLVKIKRGILSGFCLLAGFSTWYWWAQFLDQFVRSDQSWERELGFVTHREKCFHHY